MDISDLVDDAEVARYCAVAGLGSTATRTLLELAGDLRSDPELLAAVGDVYRTLYFTRADPSGPVARLEALAGPRAGTVNALVMLLSIPLVARRQQSRGVPAAVTEAINARHAIGWLRAAERRPGPIGVDDWHPAWFRTVASGRLYRVGRLEFEPIGFKHPFEAWRHRAGELVMVAEDGVALSADGFLTGEPVWTSSRTEHEGALVANPVLPTGQVRLRPVRLPLRDWELVLRRGGPVLDLHVPTEGTLSLEALADGMRQALVVAERFHPEHHPAGFVCASWLFCPQLPDLLRDDDGTPADGRGSRILRWQEEGYLFPDQAPDDSFLNFTFGARRVDPAAAPRDTRLRRGAIRRLENGEPLRSGGWLLLSRDLDRFGSRPYRDSSTTAIDCASVPG